MTVAPARELNKKAKRNPTFDTTAFQKNGWLSFEVLRNSGGVSAPDRILPESFGSSPESSQELYLLPKDLVVSFPNVHHDQAEGGKPAQTRANCCSALEGLQASSLDSLAYCGHGWEQSLPSAKVRASDRPKVAEHIRRLVRPEGIVIL